MGGVRGLGSQGSWVNPLEKARFLSLQKRKEPGVSSRLFEEEPPDRGQLSKNPKIAQECPDSRRGGQ